MGQRLSTAKWSSSGQSNGNHAETKKELSRIIFDELTHGVVNDTSIAYYENAIQALKDQGCDCIILGCTELGMLITDKNSPLPPYDTALIHCEAIVDYALGEG